ncbi:MAG: c-type cytochrome domain-containing protein [Pirellulaceae bacterium]
MLRCKTLQRSVAVRINCLCGVLAMIIATLFQAQLTLADEFSVQVRPILERYCTECHAADVTEADVDLGAFSSQEDFQHQSDVWVKVRHMLDSGQMPPLDAEQPSDAELQSLKNWVRLLSEARGRSVSR